jgi:predicted membrane protein
MINFKENYSDIIVNRKGISENAFMITTDILCETIPYSNYQVTKNGLELTNILKDSLELTNILKSEINIQIPKYLEFIGKWLSDIEIKNELKDANILGGFGKFEIDLDKMNIPIQDATIENLMYYNVKLLKINDIITFETNDYLPLCYC